MPAPVQVWDAVQELKDEAAWKVESIMGFATAFEAQLATGQQHDLPALQAPQQPPVDSSLSASEVIGIMQPIPVSQLCLSRPPLLPSTVTRPILTCSPALAAASPASRGQQASEVGIQSNHPIPQPRIRTTIIRLRGGALSCHPLSHCPA